MKTYQNICKTVEVHSTGKSFKTITHYVATNHSEAETQTRKHRTWMVLNVKLKIARKFK